MQKAVVISLCLFFSLSALAVREKNGHRICPTASIQMTRSTWGNSPLAVLSPLPVSAFPEHPHALIILAAFPDKAFSSTEARLEWHDITNLHGYAEHGAIGSVADYFTAQSGGRFNPTFDVVGPVVLPQPYAYYGRNTGRDDDDQNPGQMIVDACQAVDGAVDFSQYDWDGDGRVEMVFVLYAGMGENDQGDADTVWPHKSSLGSKSLQLDGVRIDTYACCNEIAGDGQSLSGMGTICHEFSHCLGLPDMYNTLTNDPLLDEWDLMDGGCYALGGWVPVNYSAYEKMLCGWCEPEELTEDIVLSGVVPLSQGGQAYLLRNNAVRNDYYLLELRLWDGWDTFLPGEGLLITHVKNRTVEIVCADNLDYAASEQAVKQKGLPRYNADGRSNYLSHAAYPYAGNDSLTLHSRPANTIGKPITDIRVEDGVGAFAVTQSVGTAIQSPSVRPDPVPVLFLDLQGRSYPVDHNEQLPAGCYILRLSDGTTKKVFR